MVIYRSNYVYQLSHLRYLCCGHRPIFILVIHKYSGKQSKYLTIFFRKKMGFYSRSVSRYVYPEWSIYNFSNVTEKCTRNNIMNIKPSRTSYALHNGRFSPTRFHNIFTSLLRVSPRIFRAIKSLRFRTWRYLRRSIVRTVTLRAVDRLQLVVYANSQFIPWIQFSLSIVSISYIDEERAHTNTIHTCTRYICVWRVKMSGGISSSKSINRAHILVRYVTPLWTITFNRGHRRYFSQRQSDKPGINRAFTLINFMIPEHLYER